MRILLEELDHQKQALKAIIDNFVGLEENQSKSNSLMYSNPLIKKSRELEANIDIKMETGTGKTYVGVRAMYELHKQYGLFKFIVVVPSPAIKEGWKNFIQADYAKQHFSQYYENTRINLSVINSGDFNSKKGYMPAHLVDFLEGSKLNSNTIHVLLINDKMLLSKNIKGVSTSGKNKGQGLFNQTVLSGYDKPIEALQAIKPVVIIDEPHRFSSGNENYKAILGLNPQMIIRFGATFPEKTEGKGRNKIVTKDYYRAMPQYDLNAICSFNQGLVKGIDIYYPKVTEEAAKHKYIVDSCSAKKLVLKFSNTLFEYGVGDELPFDGNVTYEGAKLLSTGLEIEKGMAFIPATMSSSYQELILRDAIEKHFIAEIKNFMRDNTTKPKVKTLSLIFIDSIKSYRDEDGWLKTIFEKLLTEKVETLIAEYSKKTSVREQEYLSFLRATLAQLKENVHAGYFSEDRGSGDEAIQAEVDDILRNKEKLLSFKDEKGNWETRRFLFSKWTLREGWDNPNVFVIAKLRTSGSENSKIQEVGRGLRLPVDENGHRLLQTELDSRLSFLIGYDEKDFVQKLISQVNSDVNVQLNEITLTEDLINHILSVDTSLTKDSLLEKLDDANIINRSNDFKEGGFDKLVSMFPAVFKDSRVGKEHITDGGLKRKDRVKLRKSNWNQMRDLWQAFSNRYMIKFDRLNETELKELIDACMNNDDNFTLKKVEFNKESVVYTKKEQKMGVQESNYSLEYGQTILPGMVYGEFVIKLARLTRLKPVQIHRSLYSTIKNKYKSDTRYLNEDTLNNLSRDFKSKFEEKYEQYYHYEKLDFQANTSIYDTSKQDFKEDILATALGVYEDDSVGENSRYLYETPPIRYDSSDPEQILLKRDYESNVITFGKLPKRAIQVPKYMGGTTTPDFIYVVENANKQKVYLLVETKAEGSGKRESDAQILKIQRKFFEKLKNQGIEYKEATSAQEVYSLLNKIASSK